MIIENEMKAEAPTIKTGLGGLRDRMMPILKAAADSCEAPTSHVYMSDESGINILASYGAYEETTVSAAKKILGTLETDNGLTVIQDIRDHHHIASLLSDMDTDDVRFFAGALFRSEDENNIGAFCICNSEPLELSDVQIQLLQVMSDSAKTHLMLYKQTELSNENSRKLNITSALLKNSADLTFLLDPELGKITSVSDGVEKVLGYSPELLEGVPFNDIVEADELEGDTIDQWFSTKEQHRGRYSTSIQLINQQGRKRWFQCNFSFDKDQWYVTARDISDKKEADQGIYELQERLKKIVSVATDLIYNLNWDSGDLSWGAELTDVLGYPNTERFVDYDWWLDKVHPDDLKRVIHDVEFAVEEGAEKSKLVYRIRTFDGSYKYVMNRIYVNRNEDGTPESMIGAIVDVSELKEIEEQSNSHKKSLKEKETLLAEVHHRVKNNLAVVSGMLQLQAYSESNEQFQQKLYASIGRIKTMATIHELLYKSSSFEKLRMDENLEEIITSLVSTFDVSLDLDVSYSMDPVELKMDNALPCSLIVNEVMTNILKYAYSDGDSGRLDVFLEEEGETVTLKIRDDGKGLPEDFNDGGNGSSLGMVLIQTLTKQLKGEYSYTSLDHGVEFKLVFDKSDDQDGESGSD